MHMYIAVDLEVNLIATAGELAINTSPYCIWVYTYVY